jgi:signal transduction histidine kinase
VLLGVAVTCSAPAGWLLVALCPALFLLLSWRWGVPAVALLALTQPAIDFLGPRQDPAAALDGVWRALAVVALSAVLSLWFDDLERRSGERAALVAELRSSRAQVAELSRRAGQDAERARLAADIHDTLAQGFLSILTLVRASRGTLDRPAGADLDAVRSLLDLAGSTAEDNLAEARSMVAALSPPALAESGLVGALQRRATQLQAGTGIRTSVLVEAADAGPALPREVEVVLLRAAQELMTNAGKHSAADAVVVTLAVQAGQVVLRVADDGRGLDGATPAAAPGSTGQDARGFGLDGLQRRIADLGGTLVLTGRTPAEREGPGGGGRGTLATVVLPTPQDDP